MSGGLVRVGFDEAGLGPTLGPLVVAGFATRSTKGASRGAGSPSDDLRGPLAAAVGPPGVRDGRLEVGDSKKIHTGSRKLARIERTALATVAWIHGRVPGSVAELLELVGVGEFELAEDRRAPWWAALDEALPITSERGAIEAASAQLAAAARAAGITPLWYRADVVGAARVNRELEAEHAREGTKNTWATHAVLRMAKLALDEIDARRFAVWCDKAGGRQAYLEPLHRAFPEPSAGGGSVTLERIGERRDLSCYELSLSGADAREVELGFVMGGDRLDPRISWASILAKYLRELILRAFNRYFIARVPSLRATAGYPQDAKRFIAEVEAALGRELGLEREQWIRSL
ncbi:ribonuclease HII [Enhygromyxa salina]|uniref:Ribonuclease HII n=1 Tax=Enhygromyxa salina TaxID=215803 RepID=A0A2S9XBP7_9BACT|nr:hypothetical protein [Enhygromyxa salina]PRP90111.1 ribonuclease HII [Enhygromyxa salina]